MFLIPIGEKINLRNPPYVTLSIIILNIVIFIFFQSKDHLKYSNALDFYFQSDLAYIELSSYAEYRNELSAKFHENIGKDRYGSLYQLMQKDSFFQNELKNEHIITPQNINYIHWKSLRKEFEARLKDISGHRFGFIPSDHRFFSAITYMFFHGGLWHLFGNMIFLWLLGTMLEFNVGRRHFLALYFLGGMVAAYFYWISHYMSTVPMIGASGAISSLMGAFAVLFGKRKVKVFPSFGFYFDYLNITVLILLPAWIITEIVRGIMIPMSQVAYMAHLGGLLGGGLGAFLITKFLRFEIKDEKEDSSPHISDGNISKKMKKALKCIDNMDMVQARKILDEILEIDPSHLQALMHLFHIDKIHPETKEFHDTTRKLLQFLIENEEYHKVACDIYFEYSNSAKKALLSPEIYMKMSSLLSGFGHFETAENIIFLLLDRKMELEGLATTILKIAEQMEMEGLIQKSYQLKQLIITLFPESPEALMIREVRTL